MANFQLILSDPKSRQSIKSEVNPPASQALVGRRVGDTVDGSVLNMNIKFKITGGSDKSGVPLRGDLQGSVKKRVVLSNGPGYKPSDRGSRKRKTVRGGLISDDVYQINAVIVEGQLPQKEEPQAQPSPASNTSSSSPKKAVAPSGQTKPQSKANAPKAQNKNIKDEPKNG